MQRLKILLVVALMMIVVLGYQPASANNLLQNPGFEGNYSAWQIQYGTAQVAPNWTPWWLENSSHDPVLAQPEYKPAERWLYPKRVFEGDKAQQWFTFHKSHYGGMYQQVHGVTPGQRYRFTLVAQVWSSVSDQAFPSVAPGDPRFEVGIHPGGFAHPGHVPSPPPGVVWSGNAPMNQIIDNWYTMSVEAVAQNSTITVYIKANPQYAVKHNDIYIDAAQLVAVGAPQPAPQPPAPQPPAPQPAPSGGNTITRWTNMYQSPGGATIPNVALRPGTQVQIVSRSEAGNWVQVVADTVGGWVPATALVGAPAPAPAPGRPASGPFIQRWTNIYSTPAGATSGSAAPNTAVTVVTTDPSGNWVQVRGTFGTGWVPRTALGNYQQNAAKPPVVNNPAAKPPATGFMYGGQTHSFANPGLMADAGMQWVKFQHKWRSSDTPNAVAARISNAHASGFKVLLSIPGASHSSIDYGRYVEFLRGIAALPDPPDAIEVWNEQNIDREWPAGQISATTYVNQMLRPAYQAIKAANSKVIVISGAPAPTGFFGGCSPVGCDDEPYIRAMFTAGAAAYTDCIGIHYNEGILPPSQRSGDPRGNGGHYTRYFWGMVDAYWNAAGGKRPLCFTELGYLSGKDFGGLPGGFAWANNTTVQQHAQWIADAVRLSRDSNRISMAIVFNVDLTHFDMNGDPQAGYAMLRPNGGCPACETLRAAMKK